MSNAPQSSMVKTLSQTPFDLNVRKDIIWDFSGVPVKFVDDDMLISLLWASFSAAAPSVERFFIRQLKPTIDTIKDDPKLIQDVQDMIAQEVHHSAAHIKLNKQLESLGYDIQGAIKDVEITLGKMTRGFTPVDMLGVVAAGEHALYSIAHAFIDTPEVRKAMHPKVERLFLYHFLEEAEHGAVSHDQYRYFAGNNYWHRLKTAARAAYVFRLFTSVMSILAKGLGVKSSPRSRLRLFYYMWFKPGLFRKVSWHLFEYVLPWYQLTFDHDDVELMKQWDRELYAGQPERIDA